MVDNRDRKEIFACECHSNEHMVVAGIHSWDDCDSDFYLQVTADVNRSWYQRIWPAVKYLFGQPTLSWHDVLLSPADVKRLQSVINDYDALQLSASTNEKGNQDD